MDWGRAVFLLMYFVACWAMGKWNERRGHSFLFGFAWSFFFTPFIAFIVIMFSGKTKKADENDQIKSGEMKKCPKCAELIKAEALKCRYCGTEFAA